MAEKHCKWYNDEFCTNGDSPCVADYCPVVEYPELCKHREVVKGINVRSKDDTDTNVGMTDEEVVKALECCANDEMCRECPYFINGIDCGNQRSENDYLDLIQRLQDNNEGLKSMNRWLLDRCKIKDGEISEQKAEIERLKEVNAGLALANLCDLPPNEDCLTDNEFEIARKTIAEQREEIERLKEENGEFFPNIYDFIEVRQKRMVEPYKDALTYILRELKLEFGGEDEAN